MARKVLVGMLLLGALFLFGLATFYVENWQFYLGKGYRLHVRFPLVQTLDTGDTVRMAGVPVGTVEQLEVDTDVRDLPVTMTLWIRTGIVVRSDDTAVVKMSSLFGGYYVGIERGDQSAAPLADGDWISKTVVASSITEVIEQSTRTLSAVSDAFQRINTIADELVEGKGTLGHLLKDEDLYKQIQTLVADAQESAASLKEATARLDAGEGVLGKLLMNDQLAADVETMTTDAKELTASLRELSDGLEQGKGTLGRLLQDEEMSTQLKDGVASLSQAAKDLNEGKGILAQMLHDDELAAEVRSITADTREVASNLREVSDKLAAGEGALGMLLNDEKSQQKLTNALDNIESFSTTLAQGEGTLGKLARDDKLYQQLTAIATDLQAMLDAYREQSPVITLAGAVFGAF